MRCVVGLVLFIVLYFGSCRVLSEAVTVRHGKATAQRVLKTWHAPIAVAVGLITITGCTLPWLLMRMNERNKWREFEDYQSGM